MNWWPLRLQRTADGPLARSKILDAVHRSLRYREMLMGEQGVWVY